MRLRNRTRRAKRKIQRKPRPTDYALIKGYLPDLRSRGNDFPFVWTSTFMEGLNRMVTISKDGSIIDFHSENHGYIDYVYGGVQPSLTIDYKMSLSLKNKIKIDFNTLEDKPFEQEKVVEEEHDVNKESSSDNFAEIILSDDDLPF